MPVNIRLLVFLGAVCISTAGSAGDWSGYAGAEVRIFTQNPLDPVQRGDNVSLVVEPEYYHEWDDHHQSLAFVPYFRLDQHDRERTHFDIRELSWLKAADTWELRLGVRKVFWGVVEFQHLVDIINQTDLVEDIDGEDKLGQPMVNLAIIRGWGTVDLYLLPWFRERTFPGIKGRLRTQPYVSRDRVLYESAAKDKHIDFAIRYSRVLGDWDIGLAHFHGTGREPRLLPGLDGAGRPVFIPLYNIIDQTSLDLQATKGNTLWKLEALHRSGQGETFNALAGGLEYTFTGVFDSVADMGVLAEYHYDDRGDRATTVFQDDIALGMRLAFNDVQSSEALLGLIWDRDTGGKFFNLEASRRIKDHYLLEMKARFFFDQSAADPAFFINRDDYVELFLTYNF